MVDIDPYMLPHRKPVGASSKYGDLKPMTAMVPPQPTPQQQQQLQQQARAHAHSRTVSSNIFPLPQATTSPPPPTTYQYMVNNNRRTPSNATTSSKASTLNNGAFPARTNSSVTNSGNSLRRSTSSRSGQSITPTSYVALMRKQKATVWCDRAQQEDAKSLAQQRAAKTRATLEVIGNNARSSTTGGVGSGSLGVRSKIRHHTALKASYGSSTIGGVPMRLSASEVDDQGTEEDADSQRNLQQKTGSGRSSFASNSRLAGYPHRFSSGRVSEGSTPGERYGDDPNDLDAGDTPMPGQQQLQRGEGDYFQQPPGNSGSGSSSERESSFGNVAEMQAPVAAASKKEEGKSWEELNRRGSVDERAATMRGAVRLFVANPDLDD